MLKPDFTFIHTVTLRRWKKQGIGGAEYEPTPETPSCRVKLARKRFTKTGSTGGAIQEVVANGTILFTAGTRIPIESEITYEGKKYTVISCEPIFDFEENHVEVIIL